MRITVFTENYCRGGVDTFIVTLLNHWPESGDEFTLICNDDHPGLRDLREKLIRPCRIVTYRLPTYAGLAARTRKYRRLDLVRRVFSPVMKYLYLARAVRSLRPLLCNDAADRLLVVNGGYPGGDMCRAAGIVWGRNAGKPAGIHNFHNLATPPQRFTRLQENAVDALLAKYTKAFVTVSRAAAQSLAVRPVLFGLPEKLHYIYNGIDMRPEARSDASIRNELGVPLDAPLCLLLGTYEPRKGHHFLLQAFRRVLARIPAAHFLACGYGSEEEMGAVRQMATRLGIDGHVHLLGFRDDAMQLLTQADVLLVGSQEFESFGLTCVEAMARRIPVVATGVGGLPEVVADGEGGYCTGKDDVDLFAERVCLLLSDEKLRKEQGDKGYARYRSLFTAERMAKEYARLLRGDDA